MKWLVALMSGLGAVAGLVVAIVTHHDGTTATGWTGYVAVNQTRYADYLPKHGASWLPGLVIGPVVGALAGLVVALLLTWFGFRLTRGSSAG